MRHAVILCLAVLACDPKPADPVATPQVLDASPPYGSVVLDAAPDVTAQVEARDVLISDPAKLAALYGYDLVTLVGGKLAWGDAVSVIEADVAEAKRIDPASGPGLAFGHRLLDTKLLHDAAGRWELIGVSARFDRDFVEPTHCGELRFIFRLRYEKTVKGLTIASRMPATAAVSFWNAKSSAECSDVWKSWPKIPPPAELAPRFKSVELDVQTVRWPSTIRGDMAGHAEYTLRALVRSPKDPLRLIAGTLENTPDVERANRDPAFKKELYAWIVDPANAKRIEDGTAILPEKFLSTKALDVTPHGLARRHNRPFRRLFSSSELRESTARRLDGMSCPGCHASRSIAGFHFLGDETAPKDSVNAILVGRSPHLLDELARRKADLAARIAGKSTHPIPFADHTSARGDNGAHCALGSDFTDWTCAGGLVCAHDVGSDEDGVGVCSPAKSGVGDACEVGRMALSANPHADRVAKMETSPCTCDTNHVGFPNGMCTGACGVLGAGEACGAIPQLTQFNSCLGGSTSFEDCIKKNSTPAAVRSCDEVHPCRDDYVCARAGNSAGTCMPPYFLFQLRVDGHP